MSSCVRSTTAAAAVCARSSTKSAGPIARRNVCSRAMSIFSGRRFCGATHHAESPIFGCGSAGGTRVRGTIRTAAREFALAIGHHDPFRGVASKIKEKIFVLGALAGETADGLQEGRGAAEFLDFFAETIGVIGIG